MRSGGITRRWVINTLSVISVFVLATVTVASIALRQYYYRIAETTIDSKVQQSAVRTFFKSYVDSGSQTFEEGARDFVESFSYSYLMDVWVLDSSGKVVVTSSGFFDSDTGDMEDYTAALASDDGTGLWTGNNVNDEKIMAKTLTILNSDGTNAGAVRLIVSLEDLDRQHVGYTILIAIIGLIAIALVAISGSFFIRSIVRPVGRINETAKLIAKGDFSARVEKDNTNDEISELCDTVNYMCEEIARADNVKNDFISTVSHELRTPLTAIKGWAETIKFMGPEDHEMNKKGIDIIISETDRLYNIVEDLLDFSKMQSGRMTMRAEPMDAVKELNMAVDVFNDRAVRDMITLIYNEPEFTAPMLADKNLIKQVFANILDNAFKYTKSGGRVAVFAEISNGDFIISVADTGCGISKADLPHVKEKFYKANVSVRGSGIGLAVVDEIIAMHGGQLDISSTEGKGTVVTIFLPTDNTVVIPADNI
ncbi:MAG: HAMP domain-containing histidine kinase [Clostridiales bacterium]|nr:HAMP domain-containing histidine kinase [Clostridiales bacterium]